MTNTTVELKNIRTHIIIRRKIQFHIIKIKVTQNSIYLTKNLTIRVMRISMINQNFQCNLKAIQLITKNRRGKIARTILMPAYRRINTIRKNPGKIEKILTYIEIVIAKIIKHLIDNFSFTFLNLLINIFSTFCFFFSTNLSLN